MIHPVILKPNISRNGLLNGLVSAYEFENNALDSHGNNDGTVNGATYTSSGKVGGCYDFDGANDYIELSDIIVTGFPFSISFWFKKDLSVSQYITTHSLLSVYRGFYIIVNNDINEIIINYGDGNGGGSYNRRAVRATVSDIGDNNWHHCVCTATSVNPIDNKVWIDNVQYNTDIKSGTGNSVDWNITGAKSFIQRNWQLGNSYGNNNVDELFIYNRVLLVNDIAELYNNGNGLPYSQFTT